MQVFRPSKWQVLRRIYLSIQRGVGELAGRCADVGRIARHGVPCHRSPRHAQVDQRLGAGGGRHAGLRSGQRVLVRVLQLRARPPENPSLGHQRFLAALPAP